MTATPINFRALVEELCRAKPDEELDAPLILQLFLEKRAITKHLVTSPNWDDVMYPLLRDMTGEEGAREDISDEDFDFLVERLIERLDEDTPSHQWVAVCLEKTLDERGIEPAIRLLERSIGEEDDTTMTRANAALNILTPYQDRPEVLDAITHAAEHGIGHVAEQAKLVLQFRENRASRAEDKDEDER